MLSADLELAFLLKDRNLPLINPTRYSIMAVKAANEATIAILSYCCSSILMTVTNKYVLSGHSFNLNFFMLGIQVCSEPPVINFSKSSGIMHVERTEELIHCLHRVQFVSSPSRRSSFWASSISEISRKMKQRSVSLEEL